jgi:hypothetical protein
MLVIEESAKMYYRSVRSKAQEMHLEQELNNQLLYLHLYGCDWDDPGQIRVSLAKDFAPMSFSVVWERRQSDGSYKYMLNGGLVFHGPHDNGGDGGMPTLSVEINPNVKPHWSVHT